MRQDAAPVPRPDPSELREVICEQYGRVLTMHDLPGRSSRNYRIVTKQGQWMLKMSHPSRNARMQNVIVERLSDRLGALVPTLIRTSAGATSATVRLGGKEYVIRVTTFLGSPLRADAFKPRFYRGFGSDVARLDRALSKVDTSLTDCDLPCHLANIGRLRERLQANMTIEDCTEWLSVLDACASEVPVLQELPVQVVHSRLTPDTVLVTPDGSSVRGFVGFGDAIAGPRVVDLAVAVASFVDPESPERLLRSFTEIVAGYHGHSRLTAAELQVLPSLVACQWAGGLGMSQVRPAENGDANQGDAYELRNSHLAAQRLKFLRQIGAGHLLGRLERVTGIR